MNKYSFDEKCYELAKHFFPKSVESELNQLAQLLQDQVELSGCVNNPEVFCSCELVCNKAEKDTFG